MNFMKYHVSRNLFDISTVEKGRIDNGAVGYVLQTSSLTIEGGTVSFTTTAAYRGVCSGFFEIPEGTGAITFNFIRNEALGVKFVFYDSTKTWLNQDYTPILQDIPPATANVPSGAKYVRISFTGQITGGYSYTMSNIMLNTGSTPLPYEPYSSEVWHDTPHYVHNTSTDTITTLPAVLYPNAATATVGLKGQTVQNGTPTPDNPIMPESCGDLETSGAKAGQYKIPISSVDTTTPIYLGEVETTRRIYKYTFTGQENWTYSASGNKKRVFVTGFDRAQIATSLCSHFVNTDYVSYPDSGKYAVNTSSTTQSMIFGVTDMEITSATDWTTYLQQQYSAGTPVTVWYVLATPATGIVNEPLMKIGDYADEVSGITIPTIVGANTLSVDTTVQPSEVTVNYKGWHTGAVHERESGQWD